MPKEDANKGRLLGAHCSTEGGLVKAVGRARELGCAAIQIFTKNSNQWKARGFEQSEITGFKKAVLEAGIKTVVSHVGYLINLATGDPAVHADSMESMRLEIQRASELGIPYVVVHPGSHKEAGELVGILQVVESLARLMDDARKLKVQIVLETTAGQGSSLGYRFDHFSEVFDRLGWPKDIGLCVDTAHIFEAGYNIGTKDGYNAVIADLDLTVGIDYVRFFHLNDSKTPYGSRVDRHEHIGKGEIGTDAFRLLLNDRRFMGLPMLIETPKAEDLKADRKNLETLRALLR